MEERVTFSSGSLALAGVIHFPPGHRPGDRHPAFLVLHGFGSNKSSSNCVLPARLLADWGYAALRFDFRGCGESGGGPGRVLCLEQVEDTKAAVSFMATRPEIDPARIAVVGSSFGAAVAVYAGGVDERIAAVISSGGWGDGETKFRRQHAGPGAWDKFTRMMDDGKRARAQGRQIMVPRYDIVPIPPQLRTNLAQQSVMEFPFDTVDSMYNFQANTVVGKIAPRPLLLLHSSNDSVTPTEQSVGLFQHAGQPADLHLFAETDHFMFSEDNPRVIAVIRAWLDRYLPERR
ncbi:MAG TPA: alpha/beta hydrolase [Stellaceae bacterium]|nr:alpha/beta hydrolase [Stellaceae bacterium]